MEPYFNLSCLSRGFYDAKRSFDEPDKTAHREQFVPNPNARLREQVHEVMRFHHYSFRTEETYWLWMRRFIFFHQKRHPKEMGPVEVSAFLSHSATVA